MKRYLTAKEFAESGKLDPHENFKMALFVNTSWEREECFPPEMERMENLSVLLSVDGHVTIEPYYKNVIHKNRNSYAYALTKDNRFIRFSYRTNKCARGWVFDYAEEFPTDAKCFYFTRHNNRDFIDLSEVNLFETMRKVSNKEIFCIYKISLVQKFQYPIILPAAEWHEENDKEIAHLDAFSKEDPAAYYWEFMKYSKYEQHGVDRSGEILSSCSASTVDIYHRGYMDFLNPATFKEICSERNPLFWSREYSDLVDYDDPKGNVYEQEALGF